MSEDPVALYLEGRVSAEVALARLLLAGQSPGGIGERLEGCCGPRADALRLLLASRSERLDHLRSVFGEVSHEGGSVEAIRAMFDRAVLRAPAASVAAYSLDDPAILAAATAELVGWLQGEHLLTAEADVLDLGCGIGRVAAGIAPHVRSVLGLDVSPAMVAEANRRNGAGNVRFLTCDGAGLGFLPDAGFDLVLAVDSLPYLLQAGVAEPHMRDIARLLRPGRALAVFNLSYRNDLAADRADLHRWAAEHGFLIATNGAEPFKLWDGLAFVLRKHDGPI